MQDGPDSPVEAQVTIRNIKGLHARASAKFVKCAETFNANVMVFRDDLSVSATSIMGLMMLAASPGTTLRFVGKGPEAGPAIAALSALVACGFDEECVAEATQRSGSAGRLDG